MLTTLSHWLKFRQGLSSNSGSNTASYKVTVPDTPLSVGFRSAIALVPEKYYSSLAEGKIVPHCAEVASFATHALVLSTGEQVPCDVVVASLGTNHPTFPFMRDEHRKYLEQDGGCQLYRHLLHPRIPNVGFAGFNHGLLHIPGCELGILWLIAVMRGDLVLPPIEVSMHALICLYACMHAQYA